MKYIFWTNAEVHFLLRIKKQCLERFIRDFFGVFTTELKYAPTALQMSGALKECAHIAFFVRGLFTRKQCTNGKDKGCFPKDQNLSFEGEDEGVNP